MNRKKRLFMLCSLLMLLLPVPQGRLLADNPSQEYYREHENVYRLKAKIVHDPSICSGRKNCQHLIRGFSGRFISPQASEFDCNDQTSGISVNDAVNASQDDNVFEGETLIPMHYACFSYYTIPDRISFFDEYNLDLDQYSFHLEISSNHTAFSGVTSGGGGSDFTYEVYDPSKGVTLPARQMLKYGYVAQCGCETIELKLEPLCKPYIDAAATSFVGYPYTYSITARTECAGAEYFHSDNLYLWEYTYEGLEEPKISPNHSSTFTLSMDQDPDLPIGKNIVVRLLNGDESNSRNTRTICFYPQIPQPTRTYTHSYKVNSRLDYFNIGFDRQLNPEQKEKITKITIYDSTGVPNAQGIPESHPILQRNVNLTTLPDNLVYPIYIPIPQDIKPGKYYVTAEGVAKGRGNHPDSTRRYGSGARTAMFKVVPFMVKTNELTITDMEFTPPACHGNYGTVTVKISNIGSKSPTMNFFGLKEESGITTLKEISFSCLQSSNGEGTYKCTTATEQWQAYVAVNNGNINDAILSYVPTTNKIVLTTGTSSVTLTKEHVSSLSHTEGARVGYFAVNFSQPPKMSVPVKTHDMSGYYAVNGNVKAANDGYLEVDMGNATGGTPPYTFYYTNPSRIKITDNRIALNAGSYNVIMKDSKGCEITVPANIKNVSKTLKVKAVIGDSIACRGGYGILNAELEKASSNNILYRWYKDGNRIENGQLPTLYYASSGYYKVEAVCLETGLISSDEIVLPEPDSIHISENWVYQIFCKGQKTGKISVEARGGSPDYSYIWSNNMSGKEIHGLGAGTYQLTVIDAKGCAVQKTYTLTEPDSVVEIVVDSITHAYYDANDRWHHASVLAHAQGGSGSFSSIGAQNMADEYDFCEPDYLLPGSYKLFTWDYYHCQGYDTVTVKQIPPMQIKIVQDEENLCFGSANASCHVEITGGVPPYNIKWSNGKTGEAVKYLVQGTYSVAVTDKVGALRIADITVSHPPMLSVKQQLTQNPGYGGCKGSECEPDRKDGIIEVMVEGGTPPYSCQWKKDGVILADADTTRIEGLEGGIYLLTVTDVHGCQTQFLETLHQTPVLRAQIIAEGEIYCHGTATGKLSSVVSGGHSPYVCEWFSLSEATDGSLFNWDKPENLLAEGEVLNNIPAGWYGLKVTDSLGVAAFSHIQLRQRNAVEIILDSLRAPSYTGSVNGLFAEKAPDGYLNCRLHGGTLPYSFYWEDATEAGLERDGLEAGTYTLHVQDSAGCSAESRFTLPHTDGLFCRVEISDSIRCYNFNNGVLKGFISGGTEPYSFCWLLNGRPFDTGNTLTKNGLAAGTYALQVKDKLGVEASFETVLPQPDTLTLTLDHGNSPCAGDSAAYVMARAWGGSFPYRFTFFLNNNEEEVAATAGIPLDSASLLTRLENAFVKVEVKDRNGCRDTGSVRLKAPEKLSLAADSSDPTYTGSHWRNEAYKPLDGHISAEATGGTAPYAFSWNTGDTSAALHGLDTGLYTLTVTDAHGCSLHRDFRLERIEELSVRLLQTAPVTCHSSATAAIEASTKGGVPPYRYQWFKNDEWFLPGSNTDTDARAGHLSAGTYKVQVSDANGIISTDSLVVDQPEPLAWKEHTVDATAWSFHNGSICTEIYGGTGPYSFHWSSDKETEPDSANNCLRNIGRGTYHLRVTDSMGCEFSAEAGISSPDSLYILSYVVQNTKIGTRQGSIHLNIKGGLKPYRYQWRDDADSLLYSGSTAETIIEAENLPAGSYRFYLIDSGGAELDVRYTVKRIERLSASLLVLAEPVCPRSDNAALQSFVQGGVKPYRRQWQRWIDGRHGFETLADTGHILSGIGAGQYRFFAYDSLSDTVCAMTFIYDPAPMVAHSRMLYNSEKALTVADAEVLVWVENGHAPYKYIWNDSNLTGNDIWVKCDRQYLVTVRDKEGCEINYNLDTLFSENLDLSLRQVSPILCAGSRTAALQLDIKYGRSPFSVSWSNGDSTLQIGDLGAGVYTATVRDALGRVRSKEISLDEPAPIEVEAVLQEPSCFDFADGKISVNVSGGTGFLQLYWNTKDESPQIGSLPSGSYILRVYDQNLCVRYDTFNLGTPLPLQVHSVIDSILCPDGVGRIRWAAEGGTLPYEYLCSYADYVPRNSTTKEFWEGRVTNTLHSPVIDPAAAGYYRIIVQDSHLCTWDTVVQLVSPALPEYDLDSIRYLCLGQHIALRITAQHHLENPDYIWTYPNGETAVDDEILTDQSGTHRLLIVRDGKCFFSDSVHVEGLSDSIEAVFWVSSRIMPNQSCLLVNLSQHQPDSIVWTLPEGVTVLGMEGNYAEVSFERTGIYTLIMTTYKGSCSEQIIKTVEVSSPKNYKEDAYSLHDASEWKVYPNPTRERCILSVQSGNNITAHYRIISASTGLCAEEGEFDVVRGEIFQKEIFTANAPSGLYLLMVEYGKVRRGFKIVRL